MPQRQKQIAADWTYQATQLAGESLDLSETLQLTASSAPFRNIVVPMAMGMGMGTAFGYGSGYGATRFMGGSITQLSRSLPAVAVVGGMSGFQLAKI